MPKNGWLCCESLLTSAARPHPRGHDGEPGAPNRCDHPRSPPRHDARPHDSLGLRPRSARRATASSARLRGPPGTSSQPRRGFLDEDTRTRALAVHGKLEAARLDENLQVQASRSARVPVHIYVAGIRRRLIRTAPAQINSAVA